MTSAGSVTMFPDHTIFDYYPAFSKNLENVVGSMKILRMALNHTKIRKDVAYLRARDGFTCVRPKEPPPPPQPIWPSS